MTTNRRRPTIIDVAAHAGVSKSLVSLALRGDDGVGPATRDRILRSAAELGYRSNAQARALVQGRTGQIGVIVTDLRNPYHAEVALGVEEAAEVEGFGTFLANGRRDPTRLAAQVEAMIGHNVEGLIVVSSRVDPDALAVAAKRLPIVVVGRPETTPEGLDTVSNDDIDGARQAAEHLISLGHKDIAFATTSSRPAARARLQGYEAALRSAGLTPRTHRVPDESRHEAIDALLSSGATAVMANNDVLAIECLGRAHELGLQVPARLSLIGYDDTELAARSWPRLTSIDQHRPILGRTALALLKSRLEGRTEDRHEVIPPTLVKRDSTAAPHGVRP
ncbi:LacI family DNA-binding transcriptional regulator [Glycomyces sp. NRRL B-16210]|uniref:LacI family DNA-binding transcriptional regulator n=1 Tax=Glycomyces sp. NRRL B-16210 TaxID=1463821 RepID=UPI0004C0BAFF|nr:LacI family DNA-binding transcriptional regulator [Glycomyces sp. NRRL B-16210]